MNSTLAGQIVGKQLDEYQLDDVLGKGGMAQVYRGFDVNLRRPAAVKVIDAPFRDDEAYIRRFQREAKAIAQLQHPHIVRLYRYGQVEKLLYIAMEYIDGKDMEAVLEPYRRRRRPFPTAEARRIISQICSALDYAHSKGVVHRDIKPANIMLDKSGDVFLTDFGLVLLDDRHTQGQAFGTPHYIAPEQAVSSANAVPQSDLYAVGVILYEMFTGQWPFNAPHPYDLAMMHLSDPPPRPGTINPDISAEVETVLLKALAKEPEERFQTGAALAGALEQAVAETQSRQKLSKINQPAPLTKVGEYVVVEQISDGPASSVFKSRNKRLKRDVIVKVLFGRPDNQDHFQRQAQAIAALSHPRIVKVYEVGYDDGLHYLVMDYISGGTLEDWLAKQLSKRKTVPLPGAEEIIRSVATALDYAHAQEVIHGDLRPANIMLTQAGRMVVTDLGLAQLLQTMDRTKLGGTVRSPAYTSPEQVQGRIGDKYTDIYALGIILYELITGHTPFEANNPFEVLKMHTSNPAPSPLALNPELPQAIEPVVFRALSKAPDSRYPSAGDLATAVTQVMSL